MKKLLIFASAIMIALSGAAQGNSKKNHKNKSAKHQKHEKHSSDRDGRYDDDDRYDNRYNKRNTTGKYSKNVPSKVNAAFNRDYPNATNVTWTKERGTWTAHFGNGGIFNNNNYTATYHANGQRLDAGTTARRNRTINGIPDNDTRNPVPQRKPVDRNGDGRVTIQEKILSQKQ